MLRLCAGDFLTSARINNINKQINVWDEGVFHTFTVSTKQWLSFVNNEAQTFTHLQFIS